MKKLISCLLLVALVAMLAIPTMAANEVVAYTDNSSFDVGGKVKVDELETKRNIMDLGKDAAEYNAALEGNIQYYWFRDDVYYKDGPSITLTEADRGCEFFCRAYLFEDADRTMQCGMYDSAKFTVPKKNSTAQIPEIHDAALPDGQVGESYYVKMDCSDPDATFSLFRSSLPDGLYLTQHGEIEGTPTKAGFWYVVIIVTPEAGEEYANTKEFEITISEAADEYTLEIVEYPEKTSYKVGEKLDMTGLWVRIYTPDGFIDSRNGDKLTYFQDELLNMGERKIKISYGEAFTFFFVNVDAPGEDSVEVIETPDKVEYTKGETLNLTGLKVRVIQADGTHFESLNGDKLTIFDGPLNNVGERKIKVSYGEAFTFFYVTVKDVETEPTDTTKPTESTEPSESVTEPSVAPSGPEIEPSNPPEESSSAPSETPTESSEPVTEPSVSPSEPETEPSNPPEEGTTAPSEAPTEPSKDADVVGPTKDAREKAGMPWWGILLIALSAAGAGAGIMLIIVKKKP